VWEATEDRFIPMQAEMIVYDTDSEHPYQRFKLGDGTHDVNELPFAHAGSADEAEKAKKLTTARNISITGDMVGGASFDGSKDITINTELQGSFTGEFTGDEVSHSHTFTGKSGNATAIYTPTGTVSTQYTPKGSVTAPTISIGKTTRKVTVVTNAGTDPTYTEAKYTPSEFGHSCSNGALTLEFTKGSYTAAKFTAGAEPVYSEISYVESIDSASATAPIFTGSQETVAGTFTGEQATITSTYTPTGEISVEKITPAGDINIEYNN
jgi:hypothetical protein